MKRILTYLLCPLLFIGCSDLDDTDQIEISTYSYELLESYSPESDYYMKRHLVDYFSDLAFGAEYGNQLPILKKWNDQMNIYVEGNIDEFLAHELDTIIAEINSYATDGFVMKKVERIEQSNFFIYLGTADGFASLYPDLRTLLPDNHGLFRIHTNDNFEITSGEMFVDMERIITDEKKKHILREELTQSIGLANDISVYVNSIFYNGDSDTNVYSRLDKETIRLLYHNQIISGLNESSTRQQLEYILGIK